MKSTILSVVIVVVLIGGALFLNVRNSSTSGAEVAQANNVSMVNGTQIIDVSVKGGYHPKNSVAKAGIPTVLRFNTNGSFDCSTSVRIPSLGLSKLLPDTGSTDIDLGSPKVAMLKGVCIMGMYSFQVDFRG